MKRVNDLKSVHDEEVRIKRKKKGGKYKLDLRSPGDRKERRIEDVRSEGKRIKLGYVWVKVRWFLGNTVGRVKGMIGLGLVLVLIMNILSAVGYGKVQEERLRKEIGESVRYLSEAVRSGEEGEIEKAGEYLAVGEKRIKEITRMIKSFLYMEERLERRGSLLDQGNNLLEAAELMTEIGREFLGSLEEVKKIEEEIRGGGKVDLAAFVRLEGERWELNLERMKKLKESLDGVDKENLPEKYRKYVVEVEGNLEELIPLLEEILVQLPAFLEMVGERYPRTYLILFQNKNEMRPTGGFIGSVGVLRLNDGWIESFEMRDVYSIDGQIKEQIPPPPGFAKITLDWGLRDSNYSADFPTSAEKAKYFFEKGGGETVDGVVAINQGVVGDLLRITGPIDLAGWGYEIDENNFEVLMSVMVEMKVSGESSPKDPLFDFYPLFREKLEEGVGENLLEVMGVVAEAQRRKDLMAWSNDEEIEGFFEWLGIDGRQIVPKEGDDYLQVVRTNVAGNKSDFFVEDEIWHETVINEAGTIEDELVIRREHKWQNVWEIIWEEAYYEGVWREDLWQKAKEGEGEKYAEEVSERKKLPEKMYEILGRGANKDYMRIYLPKGIKLIKVKGIERGRISQFTEGEKTVLAFELETLPKGVKEIRLGYRLPFNFDMRGLNDYRFYFQKQGGLEPGFEKRVVVEGGGEIKASYPENLSGEMIAIKDRLEGDWFFAALVGRR